MTVATAQVLQKWYWLRGKWRMFRRKPLLFVRCTYHYLNNRFTNRLRLRTVDINVSPVCNFDCSHCYARDFVEADLVPLPVLRKAIEQLLRLGVFHFILMGGEPTVSMERLRSVIKFCRPWISYISVVSNGWLLTEGKIDELRALGVDKITISVDSGIPEEHDAFRNKAGSYRRAMRALSMIRKAGLDTAISATVTHDSLHSEGIRRLFQFAEEHEYRVDIQVAQPVGKWEGHLDMLIDDADAQYLREKYENSKVYRGGLGSIQRDVYKNFCRAGCPAVKESLSIAPNGDVLPCVFIHVSIGNIRERSIASMRDAALQLECFREYNPVCLSGEDREFIKKYLTKLVGKLKPVSFSEVFEVEGSEDHEPDASAAYRGSQ